MDGPVFERFADESPMAVIAAILLARVFSPEKLDELFEQVRTKQYTQDLLFSTVFDLMNKVVCAIEPSVHSTYQSEEIGVSPARRLCLTESELLNRPLHLPKLKIWQNADYTTFGA
jgi:hypothetical protein